MWLRKCVCVQEAGFHLEQERAGHPGPGERLESDGTKAPTVRTVRTPHAPPHDFRVNPNLFIFDYAFPPPLSFSAPFSFPVD